MASTMAQVTSFPQQDRIRVLAADNTSMNTQLLVEALARDEQIDIAGSPSKPSEILGWTKKERPDVALVSSRQGDDSSSGFALCREICATSPSTRVIMLLDCPERSAVIEAFRSGSRGVFCRTESLKSLAKCIVCVHKGQVWASSEELHFLLEAVTEPVPMRFATVGGKPLLSARELDVVRCVAEGLSNREIAQRLTLREHTVKNYLFRIFDKLGVSSRVEVVLYALSGGTPPPRTASLVSPTATKKDAATAPVIPSSGNAPLRVFRP
ncbi:MAG: response regulator transcription factor [Candidatus Sulfotelmatobacter sp.]